MIAMKHSPSLPACFRRAALLCAGLLALMNAATAQQPDIEPRVSEQVRLDDGATTAQSVHLAAIDRHRVAIGWIVAEGPAPGIYLRHREGELDLWQPIVQVQGEVGDQVRDLALAFDDEERLHLAWTALAEGRRRLFHARVENSQQSPQAAGPLAGVEPDVPADAEFPALAQVDGLGMVVVWQESGAVASVIRAAVIGADGAPRDLGRASGAAEWALAPQIISTAPLRLAWHQVDAIGGQLAISRWTGEGWAIDELEERAAGLPQAGYVTLLMGGDRFAAAWREDGAAGQAKIAVAVDGAAGAPGNWRLTLPDGEHAQPALGGDPAGRLTVRWQNFEDGAQQVCLRSLGEREAPPLVLSAPDQRFAGQGDHISIGDWSLVVWTDIARDGGRGGVYAREVDWSRPSE